jgi:hypothetical protein
MTKTKYLQNASFTAAEWGQRNPLLEAGEIGFELDSFGLVKRHKVGPGYWNDLPYEAGDEYPYTAHPTNEIGDAKGDLLGKPSTEILNLMLNPYQASVIELVQNNAGGIFETSVLLEIGQQLSGSITVGYSVTNQANLVGATPINIVSDQNIFTNEGDFPVGNAIMSIDGILEPEEQVIHTISVKATHQEGESNTGVSQIEFAPRLQWGTSGGAAIDDILTLDATPKVQLNGQLFSISSQHKRDYDITNVGYTWLIIPQMLGPANLVFSDVTDPNAPASYAMQDMGNRLIDTNVGQYVCQFYRSSFYLNSNGILRVS